MHQQTACSGVQQVVHRSAGMGIPIPVEASVRAIARITGASNTTVWPLCTDACGAADETGNPHVRAFLSGSTGELDTRRRVLYCDGVIHNARGRLMPDMCNDGAEVDRH